MPHEAQNHAGEKPVRPTSSQTRDEDWLRLLWARLVNSPSAPDTYWLTRFVILRLVGFIYLIGFLVLANQGLALFGKDGLLPAGLFIHRVEEALGSRAAAFFQLPSLFWFDASDGFLVATAWTGVALSIVVLLGFANALLMTVLWALYLSFIHIGQDWYSYGWEIQLLETGFLAIFLCPLLDARPFPRRPPPTPVFWLYRWLGFRIMVGAGLIKLRGDPCWRDLTCLYYHYETQPIPNPLSRYLFFMPHWFHKFGVLWNHFIELIVPWFGFSPRLARHIAGVLLVSFQVVLIVSGNLSFLNWLTIVPFLACFDDSFWRRVLPRFLIARVPSRCHPHPGQEPRPLLSGASGTLSSAASGGDGRGEEASLVARSNDGAMLAAPEAKPARSHQVAVAVLVLLVGFLSISPVLNLLSPRQAMNTSFDRLHLVNTYGAFGSVGKERHEIVFEGTSDDALTEQTRWQEYEFKCKPGDPHRRPCVISPYHYRLDWQIWFAAMSTPDQYPWTLHFVWKLLHNDPGTLGLLANNPFPDQPPRYVRAVFYRYQLAPLNNPKGDWWVRTRLGLWLPPFSTSDRQLRKFLAAYGWIPASE